MLGLLTIKLKESFLSVLPIIILVLILNFTIAPMPLWSLVLFLISAMIMVVGITFFNLGVDVSLTPIGMNVGSSLVKSKSLSFIVLTTFAIGVIITVAEPDLIVFAGQVNGVPNFAIISAVSIGVGLSLVGAFLRILFQVPLSYILIGCYAIGFVLSGFTSSNFLSIAWESGAVTTGPIMVPFIMALGLGLASIRGDKSTEEDSFGLIALCLIGPIITVLILGMFFDPSGGSAMVAPELGSLSDIFLLYKENLPGYLGQIAVALFPMTVWFAIFRIFRLHLSKRKVIRIAFGTIYTLSTLVLFLASANIGFMPAGYQIGGILVKNTPPLVLIVVGMVMGYFVVSAEPAVFVLKRQVEDITSGAITAKAMGQGLSIGVAVSVGLAMVRVVTGISIMYFIIPGYLFALILTFIVPRLFTSIAFDSGAVDSGP